MESGEVTVTAFRMIRRVSPKATIGSKWLVLILTVFVGAGGPVTAGTLTGKVLVALQCEGKHRNDQLAQPVLCPLRSLH